MEKQKILYIDDEEINLELFKINFDNEYSILTAGSAQQGLDLLKKETDIEVIISDLKMPGMSGIDFIEKIKSESPEKVCILLTAFTEPDVLLRGLNNESVFRYILKPWKKNNLKKVITEAFERSETV